MGMHDITVIGSGIGGLTCGALLAREGYKVLVLEKHDKIGGYAHSFKRRSYSFESGIHSVPMSEHGLVHHLLRLLGVDERIETVELPSMYHFSIPGFTGTVPSRYNDIVAWMNELFPGSRRDIGTILEGLQRNYDTIVQPVFDWENQYRPEDMNFVSKFHNRSVVQHVSDLTADPRLRQLFYTMWPYAGSTPDRSPALFYMMMWTLHLFEGSHFVKGGFSKLADALAYAITSRGGEIRTRTAAARIEVDGMQARRVITDSGETIESRLIVSNISPYTLHRDMLPDMKRRNLWLRRLSRLNPSVSCLAVYLGLKDDRNDLLPGTINFNFDTDDHASIFRNILFDTPAAVNDHLILLKTDRTEVPATLTLMRFMRASASTDWKRNKVPLAHDMINKAKAVVPELDELIDVTEIGSPSTFTRYTGNTDGALYGFENTADMYGEAKLPFNTYLPNLFQVGHWGRPGGGVWNVMLNAYTVSKVINESGALNVPVHGTRRTPNATTGPVPVRKTDTTRLRLIYPRFRKFLEGHHELDQLVADHLVGNYTMPPSLALPIIAALTPRDIEIGLTDDNIGQQINYDEKVDLVVISCFTPQAARAYTIADEFRKRGTKVILGGIHPSGRPHEAKEHADAVCVGEVEPVWHQVLADLAAGKLKPFYQFEGTFDLADFPVPRRDIFDRDIYKWDAHLVLTTRGCPVRCDGCPIPNKEGTILRMRPIKCVIDDIKSMPYREFYFTDDTIMIPGKKSTKYILELMEATKELDVSIFLASTMMMHPDPVFYRKLAAGGATSMYTVFGFDRKSRTLLGPQCTRQEWQEGIDLVRMNEDAGIHFFASFGIGFDDQDEGVFDRILKFSEDAGIDLAEFFIHTPFPGTPFGEQLERENRILHRDYNYWNTGNVVFKPKNFSAERLLEGFFHVWKGFFQNKEPQKTIRSFDVT